ncbi:hypothetical protein M569_10996 [Genlisea aurea]|uniref:Uncharacterized protein n=1 Tax=Genlisea aurea TaxID=192259 RepID=S8DV54_9LAMI|nr:hypothetical protein M569_10996 [Genlisea aurea]
MPGQAGKLPVQEAGGLVRDLDPQTIPPHGSCALPRPWRNSPQEGGDRPKPHPKFKFKFKKCRVGLEPQREGLDTGGTGSDNAWTSTLSQDTPYHH